MLSAASTSYNGKCTAIADTAVSHRPTQLTSLVPYEPEFACGIVFELALASQDFSCRNKYTNWVPATDSVTRSI